MLLAWLLKNPGNFSFTIFAKKFVICDCRKVSWPLQKYKVTAKTFTENWNLYHMRKYSVVYTLLTSFVVIFPLTILPYQLTLFTSGKFIYFKFLRLSDCALERNNDFENVLSESMCAILGDHIFHFPHKIHENQRQMGKPKMRGFINLSVLGILRGTSYSIVKDSNADLTVEKWKLKRDP